jgi:hypothetical protein
LILSAVSTLLPTLLIVVVLIPSFVPIGLAPGPALIYGLLGGSLLCALARDIFSRRFTPIERSVVEFWAHTLIFILVVVTTIGAFPLIVVPAFSESLGWAFFSSALYIRVAALAVLLLSALAVWSLRRRHWASLIASSEASGRAV